MSIVRLDSESVLFEYRISYDYNLSNLIRDRCTHLLAKMSLDEIIYSRIKVNSKLVSKSFQLKTNDCITLLHKRADEVFSSNPFSILYENDQFLIADKSSNISVSPHYPFYFNCLLNLLIEDKKMNLYPLHRIDYASSGIVIFSKNKKNNPIYHKLFLQDAIEKYYLSYHRNLSESLPVSIYGNIVPDKNSMIYSKQLYTHSESTKLADILTIQEDSGFYEIESRLFRGKSNCLRAIFSAYESEILGDIKYSKNELDYFNWLKVRDEQFLCLHAHRILFRDPFSHEQIEVKSLLKDYQRKKNYHKKIHRNDNLNPIF